MAEKKRTRRPDEPQPPKPMSDAELAQARPDQIKDAIAANRRALKQVAAEPDPGAGLPRVHAQKARQVRLATIEAHGNEVERLTTAYEMTSPNELQRTRFIEHAKSSMLRQGVAKATKPEDAAFIKTLNESLAAQQHERETRKRIQEKAELMSHPPDPRAASITAAAMADEELWDGLHRRLRELRAVSEFGTEQEVSINERLYEPEDVSTLFVILKLLEERGEVRVIQPAIGGRLGIPELPAIPKLMAAFRTSVRTGCSRTRSGAARRV